MMKRLTSNTLWITALLILALACGTAQAEDLQSYRTSTYFESGYTAFASATETTKGSFAIDVYLQVAIPFSGDDAIASYTLYVNNASKGSVVDAGDTGGSAASPSHFAASFPITEAIDSMRLVPVLANGSEKADEAVQLAPMEAPGTYTGRFGVVNNPDPTDKLNLRIAPNGQGESLRQYYNGTQAFVLAEYPDGWLAVEIGSGAGMARGYMKADYLAFGEAGDKVVPVMPTYESIVASWSLYGFPDEGAVVLGTYGLGQSFTVLARSSAWWHIQVGEITGFVRADVLVEVPAEDVPAEGTAAAGDVPPAAATSVPETKVQAATATVENGMRQYATEQVVGRGYTVIATAIETASGMYTVNINVEIPTDSTIGGEISGYILYANGGKAADIPQAWQMRATTGHVLGFAGTSAISGEITALSLVPVWTDGGEMAADAVHFTVAQ